MAQNPTAKKPEAEKAPATQTISSFLESFFCLKEIQLENLPQIQLSIDDRVDLEAFFERNGYRCQCESNFFLVKNLEKSKDLWTICSYQYFALAEKANSFAKEIEPYCNFLAGCKNQELKTLYEAKLYLVKKIREEKKNKKGKEKNSKDDDELDQAEIDLKMDGPLKLLKDLELHKRIDDIESYKLFTGDKSSLFDFILNPCTKNFIQKNEDQFSVRNDIVSSCVNSAFPIVVSNNGFVGDFVELLAKNGEYYNKVVEIVNRANKMDEKISEKQPLQTVFFGAPGTGKSYKIDHNLFEIEKNKRIGLKDLDNPEFRTTFHPDYDYAQFVGSFKPQNVCIGEKLEFDDPGQLDVATLTKFADNFVKDGDHGYVRLGMIYHKSLENFGKNKAKNIKEICKNSGNGKKNEPEVQKGVFLGKFLEENFTSKEPKIVYEFVPQVFAKAYATAWRLYLNAGHQISSKDQVYLVIEEINRGNCAQIFGDIFQLLDRDSKGFSQYSIDADCDFAEWLKTSEKGLKSVWNDYKRVVGEGKLMLPPNLNILATMNTSDQSLFPMDSAFKRRFDWNYVSISFDGKDAAKYEIDVLDSKGNRYLWKDFVEKVNKRILDLTESEDKQLGEFFIKPDDGLVISKEHFLGKVMFYLWNEVCKDEHKNGSFFQAKDESGKVNYFTFQDLYRDEGLLKRFMDELLKKDA